MSSSEQIQIGYYILAIIGLILSALYRIKLYEYLKKISKWLIAKIKQLIVFARELPSLWNISMKNSQNYESMIDFNIDYSIFQIGSYSFVDTNDSNPYFRFQYSVTNHSIYDFKIDKIDMQILYQGNKLGPRITKEGSDLPHQKTIFSETKLEGLHINVINKLKSEIKDKEKLLFQIDDIKIYFIGDKKFHKNYGNHSMEIPINRMRINQ